MKNKTILLAAVCFLISLTISFSAIGQTPAQIQYGVMRQASADYMTINFVLNEFKKGNCSSETNAKPILDNDMKIFTKQYFRFMDPEEARLYRAGNYEKFVVSNVKSVVLPAIEKEVGKIIKNRRDLCHLSLGYLLGNLESMRKNLKQAEITYEELSK